MIVITMIILRIQPPINKMHLRMLSVAFCASSITAAAPRATLLTTLTLENPLPPDAIPTEIRL